MPSTDIEVPDGALMHLVATNIAHMWGYVGLSVATNIAYMWGLAPHIRNVCCHEVPLETSHCVYNIRQSSTYARVKDEAFAL
jgi:hypothetical protein